MQDCVKRVLRGAVLCIVSWAALISFVILFCQIDFSPWPIVLSYVVVFLMLALMIVLALAAIYLTFVRLVLSLYRIWKSGHRVWAVVFLILLCLMANILYQVGHWSRVPEYDSVSEDGRYRIVVYVTNYDIWYFLPGGPGDSACHEARVDLVESATGKVLGTERGMWLSHISEVTWYADRVDVGRTAASFDLR